MLDERFLPSLIPFSSIFNGRKEQLEFAYLTFIRSKSNIQRFLFRFFSCSVSTDRHENETVGEKKRLLLSFWLRLTQPAAHFCENLFALESLFCPWTIDASELRPTRSFLAFPGWGFLFPLGRGRRVSRSVDRSSVWRRNKKAEVRKKKIGLNYARFSGYPLLNDERRLQCNCKKSIFKACMILSSCG